MNYLTAIAHSFRVPGLGVLVLPVAPVPDWLAARPLHTPVRLRLHRPGHPTLLLLATIEEISHDDQPPACALLLDADPTNPLGSDAQLELLPDEMPDEWLIM